MVNLLHESNGDQGGDIYNDTPLEKKITNIYLFGCLLPICATAFLTGLVGATYVGYDLLSGKSQRPVIEQRTNQDSLTNILEKSNLVNIDKNTKNKTHDSKRGAMHMGVVAGVSIFSLLSALYYLQGSNSQNNRLKKMGIMDS